MRPDLFTIGNFTIHGYGFMIGIGFIIALLVGEARAKRNGLSSDAVFDMAILVGVGGFLGAKILYIIVEFKDFIKAPKDFLATSGFVVYGGIITGIFIALLYCHIKKLKFMEYFDLILPEVAIAQGFGRIGCFLAGCCYGRETDSAFGVVFPAGGEAPAGVRLIPTQLISSAGDFAIATILILVAGNMKRKKKGKAGDVGCLYLLLYGIGRFAVEFLRNDYRGEIGFLSTSQFISIFIVAAGIIIYTINHKKGVKEETVKEEADINKEEEAVNNED